MKKNTLNKRQITYSVAQRLNNKIHLNHISNIISLFVDEFQKKLINESEINITNFCIFKLEKTSPRKYHNLTKNRFAISKGKTILKIKLSECCKKQIVKHLDLLQTFAEEDKL